MTALKPRDLEEIFEERMLEDDPAVPVYIGPLDYHGIMDVLPCTACQGWGNRRCYLCRGAKLIAVPTRLM